MSTERLVSSGGHGAGPLAQGTRPARIFVVDDEAPLRRVLQRMLEARGHTVALFECGEEVLEAVAAAEEPDVVLLDLKMPGIGGLETLRRIKERHADVEVIIMTAYGDVDTAVSAVKGGAYDFLTKPFASTEVAALSVEKAVERRRLIGRARQLESALGTREGFGGIIGGAPRMREVYRMIEAAARTPSAVLLTGESGTGKELVARAVHDRSDRAAHPFLAVNCSAIPDNLFESELFGHEKGAFTGAEVARPGLFEAAQGGTLFLDEVAEIPIRTQAKLLRALQEGEVKRVGANQIRKVDSRVVAATNVDLRKAIAARMFREDLYYRLNVLRIELPALRQRRSDIPLLAMHFLRKFAERAARPPLTIEPEALRALETRSWEGNVRELENVIEHAAVMCRGPSITVADLGPTDEADPAQSAQSLATLAYREAKRIALRRFDREYLEQILRRAGGKVKAAARLAGLDASNFRRLIRRNDF